MNFSVVGLKMSYAKTHWNTSTASKRAQITLGFSIPEIYNALTFITVVRHTFCDASADHFFQARKLSQTNFRIGVFRKYLLSLKLRFRQTFFTAVFIWSRFTRKLNPWVILIFRKSGVNIWNWILRFLYVQIKLNEWRWSTFTEIVTWSIFIIKKKTFASSSWNTQFRYFKFPVLISYWITTEINYSYNNKI